MKNYFLLFFLAFTTVSMAQVTEAEKNLRQQKVDTIQGWKKGGVASLNFSQASFSNWASGGQNSISANALVSLFANRTKENSLWENSLDVGYGLVKQGKDGDFIKTDDKFDFASKYGLKASKNWYYAGLFNFKTSLTPGYNYPNDSVKISEFLAPAYLLIAIGMDYKPNDDLSVFIAPISGKFTIVNNEDLADAGAFGVDPAEYNSLGELVKHGEKFRTEIGGYIRVKYKRDLMENISFETKLDLFSNYAHNPQNIDVNWQTLLSMKVNKYITTTLTTELVYDDDVLIAIDTNDDGIPDSAGKRTQFKEVLGIGITYKF